MSISKLYNAGTIPHTKSTEKAAKNKETENNIAPKSSDVHFRGKWAASKVSVRQSLGLTGKKHDAYFKSLSDRCSDLIKLLDDGKKGEEKYTYTNFKMDLTSKLNEDIETFGKDVTKLSGSNLKSRMDEKTNSAVTKPESENSKSTSEVQPDSAEVQNASVGVQNASVGVQTNSASDTKSSDNS